MKRFRITYTNPRKASRVVGVERFEGSKAFFPVTQMEVGESITKRYHTAGIKRIERIA